MAIRMLQDEVSLGANTMLAKDLMMYYDAEDDMAAFARYALENYETAGDYWKLTKEGNLEYDGFATLRDEDGNVIISNSTMRLSDTAVESALLYILGIDKNDNDKVTAVRNMMVASGITHSFDEDPSNWYWNGIQNVAVFDANIKSVSNLDHLPKNSESVLWIEGNPGEPITTASPKTEIKRQDLTALNMGKTITLESIAGLYSEIGSSGSVISRFINNTYRSTVDFLNYADTGGKTTVADAMVSNYLSADQLQMVKVSQQVFNTIYENGQDIATTMFTGTVGETQPFGITSGTIKLKRDKESDPYYLIEDHPAIDFAGAGETVTTPGGYWTYDGKSGYNAMFSLYGSDLRMRINHVNTDIITYSSDDIIGSGTESARLLDYPDKLYGTGSGTHVHVEYTLNLPYNGTYARQYVNPNTLLPSSRYFDYYLKYYDQNMRETEQRTYNRLFPNS
jgi:hypothetical protein